MTRSAFLAADQAAAVDGEHFTVTKGAPVAKKSAALATSSGEPGRFSAVRATMRSRSAGSAPCSGQSTGPGAIALTRIAGPSSRASERVSITRPALAAQ